MRKSAIVAVAAFVLAAGLAVLVAPAGAALDDATGGDAGLAERVREAAGDGRGFQSLSVAEITLDAVKHAGVGSLAPGSGDAPSPDTLYELGPSPRRSADSHWHRPPSGAPSVSRINSGPTCRNSRDPPQAL